MNRCSDYESALSGKRVLVTGGTGFIGSHLISRLLRGGCQVFALLRPNCNPWRIFGLVDQLKVLWYELGNGDIRGLEKTIGSLDIVYHMAASGVNQAFDDSAEMVRTNVMGTLEMLELGLRLRIERFVYSGSCFEYGGGSLVKEDQIPTPVSEYGATKNAGWILAQTYARRHGLPVVSLRPFNVFGPLEAPHRLIPHTILNSLKHREIELSPGDQSRDFVYVDDVIDSFVVAASSSQTGGNVFNICTGVETEVRTVVEMIFTILGGAHRACFGSLPYRRNEVGILSGNPEKAREGLGWQSATSLRDGLAKTVRWFLQNGHEYAIYALGTIGHGRQTQSAATDS